MHVNSITKRERDGYYLYSDKGVKLGGPFASSYEADSLGEYLSNTLGEAPVEEYQRMGSQHGYIEPQTTTFEGTPNPWGDLPTEREQADFRRKTRGIPSGGFDWRNIIPNTRRRFQGLFEQEEDSLLDYNPEAELHEALQRTELEEQYLRDPTRYSGPEPPVDRGWTAAPQKVMQAMGRAFPQAQAMTRFPEGLLDHRIDAPLEVDQFRELRPRTEKGGDLALVGRYNLSDSTRTALEKTGELPWYKDRAYLAFDAAADFNEFNEAYQSEFEGQDIPIESAYRDKRHNAVLKGSVSGSLHLEGKAFDVGVKRHSTEWKWLKENAPKYGWEWHEYKEGRGHFKHTGHRFLSGIG